MFKQQFKATCMIIYEFWVTIQLFGTNYNETNMLNANFIYIYLCWNYFAIIIDLLIVEFNLLINSDRQFVP